MTVGELMIELSRHGLRDQVLMRDEWDMLHAIARVTVDDENADSVIVIVSAS